MPPTTDPLSNHVWLCVCVCVCVCVSLSLHVRVTRWSGREGARACRFSKERPWMASFNQIVLLIGDAEDRQRQAVRDTCHSSFQSHVFDLRKHTDCFAAPLSYQHLQLYLNRPVCHIIMPFYISPTNASHIWSSLGQKKKNINNYFSQTYEMNEGQFICSV